MKGLEKGFPKDTNSFTFEHGKTVKIGNIKTCVFFNSRSTCMCVCKTLCMGLNKTVKIVSVSP